MAHNDELKAFYTSSAKEMKGEYRRIRRTAKSDAGTAGDGGERNWKKLLSDWLPSHYHVVTKGRIIRPGGKLTSQVDVLVLSPSYPKMLIEKEQYLAGGVVAAFECKLTLKRSHILDAMKRGAEVKAAIEEDIDMPYKECHAPIIYGLLAHSHSWKEEGSDPFANIKNAIFDALSKSPF